MWSVVQGLWILIRLILQSLFTCNHSRAYAAEGKTFCPDCGQGLLCRWVVFKCAHCGHRRPLGYLFRSVVPSETCCRFCGATETVRQILVEPEAYQLTHALLSIEVDTAADGQAYSFYQAVKATLQESMAPAAAVWLDAPPPLLTP